LHHQENQKPPAIEALLKEAVPLASFTTLKIGGTAKYFIEAGDTSSLVDAINWAQAKGLPIFILGGGSNVVIADSGFQGLVIRFNSPAQQAEIFDERHELLTVEPLWRGPKSMIYQPWSSSGHQHLIVKIGAAQDWNEFVRFCVSKNLAGVECLAGIPGNVGATPIQNVGAYGQDVSETIVAVEAFDLQNNCLVEIPASECEFGYRSSRFKHRDRNRFIVTSVSYKLIPDGKPAIRYTELQTYFDERSLREPSPALVSSAVYEIRKRKAMVISEDPDSRSVGSFFVNPTISQAAFIEVRERAGKFLRAGQSLPTFPAANQQVKLSAAWLIERAGITRGYVYGNVGTSTKHALAIINRGNGTAREVIELAELIQVRVLDTFGVELTPEPVFVGFD
jgi:UDP-N-acetylmuramate dehydrogenase